MVLKYGYHHNDQKNVRYFQSLQLVCDLDIPKRESVTVPKGYSVMNTKNDLC